MIPSPTSGSPKRAFSLATRRWHARASSHPPPQRVPSYGGKHGFGKTLDLRTNPLPLSAELHGGGRRQLSDLANVCSGDKGLFASPDQDHTLDIVVLPEIAEHIPYLTKDLRIQSVELVGAVDHDDRQLVVPPHSNVLKITHNRLGTI